MLSSAVVVDLIISLSTYAAVVTVASVPLKVPSSCVTDNSPELSNARTLLALSVAPTVNSVDVIVLVRDSFKLLSTSSCCCCAINVSLSSASSWLSAGNGSLAV